MTAGQASGLSSTGSRGISRYSEDEIVRDVSTALDMTELLSSVAGRLYPLPLQKGEDKGEGLISVARGFNRTIGFHLSTPHLRPLSARGGEGTVASSAWFKRGVRWQPTLHD